MACLHDRAFIASTELRREVLSLLVALRNLFRDFLNFLLAASQSSCYVGERCSRSLKEEQKEKL